MQFINSICKIWCKSFANILLKNYNLFFSNEILPQKNFAFGDLKMHNFRPFYSVSLILVSKKCFEALFLGLISKYDFWGCHASFPKKLLQFAT